MEAGEQCLPVIRELVKTCLDLFVGLVAVKHLKSSCLIDNFIAGCRSFRPFLVFRILDISEYEVKTLRFTGNEGDIDLLSGNRRPAAADRVFASAVEDSLRPVCTVVHSNEFGTDGIKSVNTAVYAADCIVIAALAVFGFMEDCGADNLDLAGRKIALEVLAVIGSIPQTPLHIGVQLYFFRFLRAVGELYLFHFAGVIQRDKGKDGGFDSVLAAAEPAVAKAMAALIRVEPGSRRLPCRIPEGIAVLNVEILAVAVVWDIIVAVACDAEQLCILIEGIAAHRVGDNTEEVLVAEIIDPRQRSRRSSDDIFLTGIIKIAEFHCCLPFLFIGCHKISGFFPRV